MAKYCPILKRKVVYLDCLECETKECEKQSDFLKDSNKQINIKDKISTN